MAKIKDLLGKSVQPNSSILGGRFSAANLNREATEFDIKAMKEYGFPLTVDEVTYSQKYPDGYAKTVKNYGGQTLNSDQRMLSRLSSAQQQELAKADKGYANALAEMKLIDQYTTAAKSAAGNSTGQVGGSTPGTTSSSASSSGTAPTIDSEIKRAQDVWANADSLAGTGKYVGKTADQIRESAHAYAQSLRDGTGTLDTTAGGTYTPGQTGTTPGTTTTPTTPADPVANAAGYDAALKQMESDPNFKNLPPSIQSLFRDTLKSYDFNKELNVPNVLAEFNRIKTETIDPRFSQEVNKFTNDLTKEVNALNVSRDIEKETLAANAGQDIRQAKAGLEKAGMTFTGQGVEQLGAGSAYAQPGANVATPVQTGFGGLFNEGTVNQSSRLMASSASNRYNQSINALGQQAENALGGAAVPGLVPGYSPSGTLPGSYADTKQAQYGQTLSQLMGQNYQNISNNKNLNYNL